MDCFIVFELLWIVLLFLSCCGFFYCFWVAVDCFDRHRSDYWESLWVVVDRCGSFLVLVRKPYLTRKRP